jgi:phycocyanobilin:ferredoxin oxidoreductase
LSESLTKNKLKDPLILNLVQNIRRHRSNLENLKSVRINPKLSNVTLKENGKELFIENEIHKARGFRKLHIEIGEFSKNLKILHCVFFPDPKFNIPIFGMDLVKINNIVSAAIVDISPVSKRKDLKLKKILGNVDKSSFSTLREIPNWGNIFSDNVIFASLKNEFEKDAFCYIVDEYLSTIIKLSSEACPELDNELIQERIDFQKNYCLQQMKNDKTKMVLLKYFDENWVNNYIEKVLFDF